MLLALGRSLSELMPFSERVVHPAVRRMAKRSAMRSVMVLLPNETGSTGARPIQFVDEPEITWVRLRWPVHYPSRRES